MRSRKCAMTCRRASWSRSCSGQNVDGGAISYYAVTTTALDPAGAQLVHRQYRHQAAARRCPASRKSRATAASTGRFASSSIRRGCRRLGLTAVEVNDQLRALNLDAPGGRAQVGGGEQAIRVLGGAKTAEDSGGDADHRERRPLVSPARDRRRARRYRGGALHRPAERPAGDRVRRLQGQGRVRRERLAGGASGARRRCKRRPRLCT